MMIVLWSSIVHVYAKESAQSVRKNGYMSWPSSCVKPKDYIGKQKNLRLDQCLIACDVAGDHICKGFMVYKNHYSTSPNAKKQGYCQLTSTDHADTECDGNSLNVDFWTRVPGYERWSDWSECSVSCGIGYERRWCDKPFKMCDRLMRRQCSLWPCEYGEPTWEYCSMDKEMCDCKGWVRYGYPGRWSAYKKAYNNEVQFCGVTVFGDPSPGHTKYCECTTWPEKNLALIDLYIYHQSRKNEQPYKEGPPQITLEDELTTGIVAVLVLLMIGLLITIIVHFTPQTFGLMSPEEASQRWTRIRTNARSMSATWGSNSRTESKEQDKKQEITQTAEVTDGNQTVVGVKEEQTGQIALRNMTSPQISPARTQTQEGPSLFQQAIAAKKKKDKEEEVNNSAAFDEAQAILDQHKIEKAREVQQAAMQRQQMLHEAQMAENHQKSMKKQRELSHFGKQSKVFSFEDKRRKSKSKYEMRHQVEEVVRRVTVNDGQSEGTQLSTSLDGELNRRGTTPPTNTLATFDELMERTKMKKTS